MLISSVIESLGRRIHRQGRKVDHIGAGRIGPLDIGTRSGCATLVAYGRTNRHETGSKRHRKNRGPRFRPISFAQSGLGMLCALSYRAINHGATSWDVVRFLLHFPK